MASPQRRRPVAPSRSLQDSPFRPACAWGKAPRRSDWDHSPLMPGNLACREAKSVAPFLFSRRPLSRRKRAHDGIERGLTLEADARPVGQWEIAALQLGVIGKTAEGAEYAGIGFRAAETETAGNRQRHLIAAVGKQCTARPAVSLDHRDGACILHDAVGLRRIDLDDVVAVRA